MKKGCLKTLLGGAILIVLLFIIAKIFQKPLPTGNEGIPADQLARKMMSAVNCEAWDTTNWVSWSFAGAHHYVWDKKRQLLQAEWGTTKVLLRLDTQQGLAYKDGQEVTGKKADKALRKAWSFFCNDSFWLNPVCKAFDPGTQRTLVDLDNGEQGVAVTYTSGGVTPGDTYLWELEKSGRPKRWRMWVKIIPIGGVPTDWSDWQQIPGGAWIAGKRQLGFFNLQLDNVHAAASWQELQLQSDPFVPLQREQL